MAWLKIFNLFHYNNIIVQRAIIFRFLAEQCKYIGIGFAMMCVFVTLFIEYRIFCDNKVNLLDTLGGQK